MSAPPTPTRRTLAGAVPWAALVLATLAGSGSAAGLAPGDHDLRVRVGERTRSYWLHVPPAAQPSGDAGEAAGLPLLIAFHGGGGRAASFQANAGLDVVADREGFVVAYPDGSGAPGRRLLTWNAGGCCGRAMREQVDDVAFTRALIDDVAARVAVDRARVYVTGHSNGAMMAYRVAAEAPEIVAAVAPVGGAMQVEDFSAARPVPVLHVHSTDDPRALYAGGLGPPFPVTRKRVHHNPVERELQRWVVLNGCRVEPEVVEERKEAATGHTAVHLRFAPCRSGAVVELWRLGGAGHGWPGGGAELGPRVLGPSTGVVSASEEVWRFVSRFRNERAGRTAAAPASASARGPADD